MITIKFKVAGSRSKVNITSEFWWKRVDSGSAQLDMVCGGPNFFNFAEF